MQKTLVTQQHKALIALLIDCREKAGLTQSELATHIGEYQSFVARLESGQRRLDVIEFLRMATILKCDPVRIIKKLKTIKD